MLYIALGFTGPLNDEKECELSRLADKYGYGIYLGCDNADDEMRFGLSEAEEIFNWKSVIILCDSPALYGEVNTKIHNELTDWRLNGTYVPFFRFLSELQTMTRAWQSELWLAFADEWYNGMRFLLEEGSLEAFAARLKEPAEWGVQFYFYLDCPFLGSADLPLVYRFTGENNGQDDSSPSTRTISSYETRFSIADTSIFFAFTEKLSRNILKQITKLAAKYGYGIDIGIERADPRVKRGLARASEHKDWTEHLFIRSPKGNKTAIATGIQRELYACETDRAAAPFFGFLRDVDEILGKVFPVYYLGFAEEWPGKVITPIDKTILLDGVVSTVIERLRRPANWRERIFNPSGCFYEDFGKMKIIFEVHRCSCPSPITET